MSAAHWREDIARLLDHVTDVTTLRDAWRILMAQSLQERGRNPDGR